MVEGQDKELENLGKGLGDYNEISKLAEHEDGKDNI